MNNDELKDRTRRYPLRIIKLVESLPKTQTAGVIGKQLLRSGTSVGANYRAACRAKSTADFIAKMGIVEEEADETICWIEMLIDTNLIKPNLVENLLDEANQLVSIFVSSINTARGGKR